MGYTDCQRDHFKQWLAESEHYFEITSVVLLDALMTFFISLFREEES